MIRVTIGASFCICLVTGALGHALAPDLVRVRLEQAKLAYQMDMGRFGQAVADYFDKREAEIRNDPSATAAEAADKRQKLLEQIKTDREKFDGSGELPKTFPVEVFRLSTAARAKLEAAYELAVKDYTIARKVDDATAIENELKRFKTGAFPHLRLELPGPFLARQAAAKAALLKQDGGNEESEAAVARALAWLAKQQNVAGGFWEFDGSHKGDRVAATGMCLLPFFAAGETHKNATKYKATVQKGLEYLMSQVKPDGQFGGAGMYSQAVATIALCEAAGMTRDEKITKAARLAVDFIVKAQAGDGSWGYSAGAQGDTSIVGWQIQALQSARLARIPVPKKTFEQAELFLESVSDAGATYGYRSKGSTHTLTGVGLLCRQYMGWTPRNPMLARGVDWIWTKFPPKEDDWNLYYYYYATQVVHFFGGPVWRRDWNPKMREIILKKQLTEKTQGAKPADFGSFPKDSGSIGASCGKLGTTALACLTLEVYYRYTKRDLTAPAPDSLPEAKAEPEPIKQPEVKKEPEPKKEPELKKEPAAKKVADADQLAMEEKQAAANLKLLRPLIRTRKKFVIAKLEQLIRRYPKTETAKEAQSLLDELKKGD